MHKSKLLALLLAVAMVASMIVVPVAYAEPATEEESDVSTPIEDLSEVACEVCGAADWTEVAAEEWAAGGPLEAGHYKLTGDQTLTAALTVAADASVCIDLNGYTIAADTADGPHRNIESAGTLAIMDSSENETGTISGGKTLEKSTTDAISNDGEDGGNIYVSGGTFELYGGTITGGVAKRGGNVHVASSTFNMYGGTVTGGNAYRGGNVCVTYDADTKDTTGIANIYGGIISDGRDNFCGANLAVITGSKVETKNTLNIYGGTISGGTSTGGRATVYNLYSDMNIYGGNISSYVGGGDGAKDDDTIYKAHTTIYGGTFTGNVILGTEEDYAETNIYNGEFSKDVSEYKAACACVDGNKVWHDQENCGCAYEAALTADAGDDKYTIVQQTGNHTPAPDATSDTGYSCSFCKKANLPAPNNKEALCADTACTENHTWYPWTGVETNGYYYVAGSFTLSGQVTVAADNTLCLDLNGMTVTSADSTRMFLVEEGGTLNLMDLSASQDGTLEGNGTVTVTKTYLGGAIVYCAGNFNMYSGTIQNGSATRDASCFGGNIFITGGTFNMKGGTITGGEIDDTSKTSGSGGNLCVAGGGTATISGGTIENGQAGYRGGNIATQGKDSNITISGTAIVKGGKSSTRMEGNGDNIYVGKNGALTIKAGATIGADDGQKDNIGVGSSVTVTIENGVYSHELAGLSATYWPSYTVYNTVVGADKVTYYAGYETLTDALNAAVEGNTVNLTDDITDAGEINLDGETLNLNGHKLAATSVNATIGNVIDSSNGNGKLVSDDVTFDKDNTMVPVTTVDGTVFEKADITEKWLSDEYDPTKGATTGKYIFYINPLKANTNMDDAMLNETNALKLGVKVTWSVDGDDKQSQIFNLDSAKLKTFVEEKWDTSALVLTLTNLEGVTIHSVEAVIESNGATVYNANNG